jgi:large subunit ribosomal protein L15
MLDRLSVKHGSRKPRRRIGRGIGSGSGKTSGRGTKGAGARTGYKDRAWTEGGQMPLARRLPKRGFHNPFSVVHQVVNVGQLGRFAAGSEVDREALRRAGLVRSARLPVKLLGEGALATSLRLRVHAASESARRKVEGAGGSVDLVSGPGSSRRRARAARRARPRAAPAQSRPAPEPEAAAREGGRKRAPRAKKQPEGGESGA